jgi:transcriptional regulator with XRE-family HTH domain
MTDPGPPLTPLGRLLEDARQALGLSKREAARRSGFTEGRWRQVVTGLQNTKDVNTPSNPRSATVAAMARAVGADVNEALRLAGLEATPGTGAGTPSSDAFRRVMLSSLSDEQKRDIMQMLLREQREAERRQEQRAEELIELFRTQQ